jgi:hypothetical protein
MVQAKRKYFLQKRAKIYSTQVLKNQNKSSKYLGLFFHTWMSNHYLELPNKSENCTN